MTKQEEEVIYFPKPREGEEEKQGTYKQEPDSLNNTQGIKENQDRGSNPFPVTKKENGRVKQMTINQDAQILLNRPKNKENRFLYMTGRDHECIYPLSTLAMTVYSHDFLLLT